MLSSNPVPGAPIWIDLATHDIDAAVAFYRAVFGWEFQSLGPDVGGYGFFQLGGRMLGAAGPIPPGNTRQPGWAVYFHTADIEATTRAVGSAGGKVLTPPMDVMTFGRMAEYADPAGGARFSVWQPLQHTGFEVVNEPGSLVWTELTTLDAAAAKAFYASVLDWTYAEPMPGYNVVTPAAEWHPYINVEDPDAVADAVRTAGGTVLMGPDHLAGVGVLGSFLDPEGAKFCMLKPDPRTA